ncbi:MAG: glycosyltransferase family 2 protein [Phycisphaerales bacterium]
MLVDVIMVLLLLCAILCALYWLTVAYQVRATRLRLPTARDGIRLAEDNPPTQRVCVIVPCHNEAGNIGTLIASLKEQDYDRLRVVLALDRCTDDTIGVATRAIGDDERFEIIEITQCPDDWAGKVHAAYTGYTQSHHAGKADTLVFTDADTEMDPMCVRACIALMRDRKLDFLSLLSTLTTDTWFERVVQPVTAFELARQFPLLRVNRSDENRRAFANGQFMMFDRAVYDAIGGHELVKHAILEDIAFAYWIKANGHLGGLLMADTMLRCRMYDSWSEYTRGWKRIYTESANREIKRLRRYALRTPILTAVLPLLAFALVILSLFRGPDFAGLGVGLVAIMSWFVGLSSVYRISHAPLRDMPLSIVGAVLTGRIFWQAASDLATGTPTLWGGRSYVRKAEG